MPFVVNMHRFFVEEKNIENQRIIIDSPDDVHHIKQVLRLQEGEDLEISDGKEWEYVAKITDLDRDRVVASILDKQKFSAEPEVNITLFQGVPKQDKMDWITQKNTELGVREIVPVFTHRTVVKHKDNYWKKRIRYQSIAQEAAKQSGRGCVPEIRGEISFQEMIPRLSAFDLVFFAYEEEEGQTMRGVLEGLETKPKNIAIVIGPEGGFSKEEAMAMKETKAHSVSLGKTTLRTETAGMIALAFCVYALEL